MTSGSSEFWRLLPLFFLATVTQVGAGITVEPSHLYLDADAGKTLSASITVESTDGGLTIAPVLQPFIINVQGEPKTTQTAGDRDLDQWVRVIPEGRRVDLEIVVPASARGTYWGALVISETPKQKVATRVIVPIFLTIRGGTAAVEIESFDATADGDGVVVRTILRNDSDTLVRPAIIVALEQRSSGDEIAQVEEPPILLLPRSKREITTKVRADIDGTLDAAVYLSYGDSARRVHARTRVLPRSR